MTTDSRFIDNKPTRTEKTLAEYRRHPFVNKHLPFLLATYFSPGAVERLKEDWKSWCHKAPITRRKACYALTAVAEEHNIQQMVAELVQWMHTYSRVYGISRPKTRRTSAKKATTLSGVLRTYIELSFASANLSEGGCEPVNIIDLIDSPMESRALALFYFIARIGTRPCELESLEFCWTDERKWFVLIKNGKNTNGRSTGEYRTVGLENFSDIQIETLQIIHCAYLYWLNEFRDRVRSVENGDTQKINDQGHSNLIRALNRVMTKALLRRFFEAGGKLPKGRTIALYTARHMFCADVKLVCTPVAVAAVLGQVSTRTATKHYAPANSGRSRRSIPTANPAEMAKVREYATKQFDALALKPQSPSISFGGMGI